MPSRANSEIATTRMVQVPLPTPVSTQSAQRIAPKRNRMQRRARMCVILSISRERVWRLAATGDHTFGGNFNFNLFLRKGGTLYIDSGRRPGFGSDSEQFGSVARGEIPPARQTFNSVCFAICSKSRFRSERKDYE